MMTAEHHYVYTGEGDPPENATHVTIHNSITVIPFRLFFKHQNIVELICHDGVIKIEAGAFYNCPRLKRLIMPGVEEIEERAFHDCESIEHVECPKLEIIRTYAFCNCVSLGSIDLPSAKVVAEFVFDHCEVLTDVKFGKNLESIGKQAFCKTALKRITIPLKSGLFANDDVFVCCDDFGQVCLIEEVIIQETMDALLLDEWKIDMNEELDSINQILPNVYAGDYDYENENDHPGEGEKTRTIRDWMRRGRQKIIHYKVEHYCLLSLAATELAHASPNEIVIDSVLSFLELPDHVFEGEGNSRTTTPALDRELWEDIVQMEQRLLEKEKEIALLRSKCLIKKDKEIATSSLKALNDEKEDEIHQLKQQEAQLELQVAEFGGAMTMNDADGLTTKRLRGS